MDHVLKLYVSIRRVLPSSVVAVKVLGSTVAAFWNVLYAATRGRRVMRLRSMVLW